MKRKEAADWAQHQLNTGREADVVEQDLIRVHDLTPGQASAVMTRAQRAFDRGSRLGGAGGVVIGLALAAGGFGAAFVISPFEGMGTDNMFTSVGALAFVFGVLGLILAGRSLWLAIGPSK